MSSTEGYQQYRSKLAHSLTNLRRKNSTEARIYLDRERFTSYYQVSRHLHLNPNGFSVSHNERYTDDPDLNGHVKIDYEYYLSNEFYGGLVREVRGLGGVGLSVGGDFFNMANLDEVYCIDVDPHTHTVTQAYLEIGLRLRDALGRYPTTQEYIDMFSWQNLGITQSVLSAPSSRFMFPQEEIDWLGNKFFGNHVLRYLVNKEKNYGQGSWIGTDQRLKHTLEAYGQGKIHIIQNDIVGDEIIKKLSRKLNEQGREVTLIYLSNAPVHDQEYIEKLKKLPLAQSSLVIFSDRNEYRLKHVPKPIGFDGVMDWHMVIFQPLKYDVPGRYKNNLKEIAPGCYKSE